MADRGKHDLENIAHPELIGKHKNMHEMIIYLRSCISATAERDRDKPYPLPSGSISESGKSKGTGGSSREGSGSCSCSILIMQQSNAVLMFRSCNKN